MTTLNIDRTVLDMVEDADDTIVCVYCDTDTTLPDCAGCQEYKGLMPVREWEAYTGEVWES